jgi:NAD(P)-dependent dehydrogenase (short-subunit alcohol dehydrogenase family)
VAAVDPDAELAAQRARQPSGRPVGAEEVAPAIAHLAGPPASATTGIVRSVDGGVHGLRLRPTTQ